MTIKLINDLNSGKIVESQLAHPQWFQRLAEQKLRYADNTHEYHGSQPYTIQPTKNYYTKTSSRQVYEYHSDGHTSPSYLLPTSNRVVNTNSHQQMEKSNTNYQPYHNIDNHYKTENRNYHEVTDEQINANIPTYSDSYFNTKTKTINSKVTNINQQPPVENHSIQVTFDGINEDGLNTASIPSSTSIKSQYSQINNTYSGGYDIPILYRFGNSEKSNSESHTQNEDYHNHDVVHYGKSSNSYERNVEKSSIEKQIPTPIKSNRKHSIYDHLREEFNVENYSPRVVHSSNQYEFNDMEKESVNSKPVTIPTKQHTNVYEKNTNTDAVTSTLNYRPTYISSPSRYNKTYLSSLNQVTVSNTGNQKSINERCRQGIRYCGHDNEQNIDKSNTQINTHEISRIDQTNNEKWNYGEQEKGITIIPGGSVRNSHVSKTERIDESNYNNRPIQYRPQTNSETYETLRETETHNTHNTGTPEEYLYASYNKKSSNHSNEDYRNTQNYHIVPGDRYYKSEKNISENVIRESINPGPYQIHYENSLLANRRNISYNNTYGAGHKYLLDSEKPREYPTTPATTTTTTTTTEQPIEIPKYIKPPKVTIHKNRGDQPPQQFEEDYDYENILEKEPGIGYYPVGIKPEISLIPESEINKEQVNLYKPTANKTQFYNSQRQINYKKIVKCRKTNFICYIKKI